MKIFKLLFPEWKRIAKDENRYISAIKSYLTLHPKKSIRDGKRVVSAYRKRIGLRGDFSHTGDSK